MEKAQHTPLKIRANLLDTEMEAENVLCPTMLTIKEAAKTVGISCYAIRQMVIKKNSRIKFIKCGSKYLLNLDSLVNYLNTGETGQEENDIFKIKEA